MFLAYVFERITISIHSALLGTYVFLCLSEIGGHKLQANYVPRPETSDVYLQFTSFLQWTQVIKSVTDTKFPD